MRDTQIAASPWASPDDIARDNRYAGQHFFDEATMRAFGSRIHGQTRYGRVFVTSERSRYSMTQPPPRTYTVRRQRADGHIEDIGEFGEYATSAQAHRAASVYSAKLQLHDYLEET